MNSRFSLSWEPLRRAWSGIVGSSADAALGQVAADLPPSDAERVKGLMAECIAARGGEVSARHRAAILGELYLTLDQTGRTNFLQILAEAFCVDRARVEAEARRLLAADDEEDFRQSVGRMQESLVSPQQRLFCQFNALPQGIKFLIDMRADLLRFCPKVPQLKGLNRELRQLLATWFDVGFLSVQRITWDSPAALLEKLMAYEAVHAINSWSDLHHRLESDRHCYAFFHPGMPDEPLIFIEVALVEGLATSVQTLLDETAPEVAPEEADTAIFYSISNTQDGLQGISFGPFLIKQVVNNLRRELPNLKTFSTLSPLPGFRRWLVSYCRAGTAAKSETDLSKSLNEAAKILRVEPELDAVFGAPDWWQKEKVATLLREPMLSLCARYLHECRNKDQAPLDPVARFHLGNGARVEQLNWLGDVSAKGMGESCGLMVNYLYRLKDIEKNIEAYAAAKEVVASSRVRNLLRDDEEENGHLQQLRKLLSLNRNNGSNHSSS